VLCVPEFVRGGTGCVEGGYNNRNGPIKSLLESVNTIIGDRTCPKIESLNKG
jgi:hypothetical protein